MLWGFKSPAAFHKLRNGLSDDPLMREHAPMLTCMANGCARPGTRGQAWTDEPLEEIEQYQKGIKLQLSVEDLAVRLTLCENHARYLTAAAWKLALSLLDDWGWQPFRTTNG